MKKIKVGIIGCGTIGAALARAVEKKFPDQARVAALCDKHPAKAARLRAGLASKPKICTAAELVRNSEFVIEAASRDIVGEVARLVERFGREALVMSVGGLLEMPLEKFKRGRIWIPSGAVAGIDGVLAAAEAGITKALLITRKPPEGLLSAPYFKDHAFPKLSGTREVKVFKGNARQAVKAFPQNVNVAAVLSLAGAGALKTRVEIWTSKAYRRNIHEIILESGAGNLRAVIANVPSPENPKTSALAVHAAVAVLRKIFSRVRVGT